MFAMIVVGYYRALDNESPGICSHMYNAITQDKKSLTGRDFPEVYLAN